MCGDQRFTVVQLTVGKKNCLLWAFKNECCLFMNSSNSYHIASILTQENNWVKIAVLVKGLYGSGIYAPLWKPDIMLNLHLMILNSRDYLEQTATGVLRCFKLQEKITYRTILNM